MDSLEKDQHVEGAKRRKKKDSNTCEPEKVSCFFIRHEKIYKVYFFIEKKQEVEKVSTIML